MALRKNYSTEIKDLAADYVAQYFIAPATSVRMFVSVLAYIKVIAAIRRRSPALPVSIIEDFVADYQEGMQKIPIARIIIERAAMFA